MSFKQSNWLNSYADFNTEKRKQSNDEFNKNLYELLNNCIYGKSIKNIRKRMYVKLINGKKVYLKYVNKPNFISQKIIDKNFVAVHCSKKVLTLNKPVYVGFTILELSKLKMYQFHYDYVLKTFNDAKLLFTGTDSLVMKLKMVISMISVLKISIYLITVDIQKILFIIVMLIIKMLGKMKDEFNGVKIDEFVGLKSKMYSLIAENDLEVNKAKGVNLVLRHKEYFDVLFNKKVVRHRMKRIQIGTYKLNKITLSCFHDKRFALDDVINKINHC